MGDKCLIPQTSAGCGSDGVAALGVLATGKWSQHGAARTFGPGLRTTPSATMAPSCTSSSSASSAPRSSIPASVALRHLHKATRGTLQRVRGCVRASTQTLAPTSLEPAQQPRLHDGATPCECARPLRARSQRVPAACHRECRDIHAWLRGGSHVEACAATPLSARHRKFLRKIGEVLQHGRFVGANRVEERLPTDPHGARGEDPRGEGATWRN